MIEIGKYNLLKVKRGAEQGLYLTDNLGEEVLLPNKFIPEGLKVNDEIKVFIYKDSEDRIVATTQKPLITLNHFSLLKVKNESEYGAFMDWGLDKDLLVPHIEQRKDLKQGENHVVYLYHDEKTNRLAGSTKISKFLEHEHITVSVGDEVDLIVFNTTDLGYSVIINELHEGILFKNEVFQKIEIGDQLKGFIKKIRNDKKIDVSLQKFGYRNIEPNSQKILDVLKENNGCLKLTDKSDPEEITSVLGMSKKTFKKSIGYLYKQRLIILKDDSIQLIEK